MAWRLYVKCAWNAIAFVIWNYTYKKRLSIFFFLFLSCIVCAWAHIQEPYSYEPPAIWSVIEFFHPPKISVHFIVWYFLVNMARTFRMLYGDNYVMCRAQPSLANEMSYRFVDDGRLQTSEMHDIQSWIFFNLSLRYTHLWQANSSISKITHTRHFGGYWIPTPCMVPLFMIFMSDAVLWRYGTHVVCVFDERIRMRMIFSQVQSR